MKLVKLSAAAAMVMLAMGSAHAVEIYGQGGTEGLGLGVGTGLNSIIPSATSKIGLRAEVNAMPTFHHNFTAGNIDYSARAQFRSADGYVDLFPFTGSSFRLTGGVLVNDDKAEGDGMYQQGTITADGQTYNLAGQSVHGRIRYPAVMPYFGLGFGHKTTTKGFSMFGDIGVAFGRPHVDLSYNTNAVTASLPADVISAANAQLDSERNDLQSKVDKYRFFPVIKVGVSYRF